MTPFVTLEVGLADRGPGDAVPLPEGQGHHLRDVLRMTPGDVLVVSDGHGWSASAELTEGGARLTESPVVTPAPAPPIVVVHALPKGRKLDEVVRLLCELGVDRIVPVGSDHSVVSLRDDKADKATRRWRAIAESAVNQSRRPWRCRLDPPRPLDEVVTEFADAVGVVADVAADTPVRRALTDVDGTAVVLAVGPEGGWSEAEIDRFRGAGWIPVTLGPTVLRTEHAAGVLTAIVAHILGRLG
ncbi:MAG: RsmE family RNA methyltransferase [Nitriliruptorales bacterium]|nr:RsmE family RNA methyltransferase [Nitriliruptorales bacterium]